MQRIILPQKYLSDSALVVYCNNVYWNNLSLFAGLKPPTLEGGSKRLLT